MVEAYAAQQLQIPTADLDWKSWAAGLLAIDVFVNEGVPDPYLFDEWQDWASAVVGAVNPRTN
jgi:hypothetical protein